MDWTILTSGLAFFTLGIFAVLAMVSKRKTDARRKDPTAPKSTLAKDGNPNGKPADV
jgi:hypothetical protein